MANETSESEPFAAEVTGRLGKRDQALCAGPHGRVEGRARHSSEPDGPAAW